MTRRSTQTKLHRVDSAFVEKAALSSHDGKCRMAGDHLDCGTGYITLIALKALTTETAGILNLDTRVGDHCAATHAKVDESLVEDCSDHISRFHFPNT